jgi:hypothetical protein
MTFEQSKFVVYLLVVMVEPCAKFTFKVFFLASNSFGNKSFLCQLLKEISFHEVLGEVFSINLIDL